jgi:hypothetical protein
MIWWWGRVLYKVLNITLMIKEFEQGAVPYPRRLSVYLFGLSVFGLYVPLIC